MEPLTPILYEHATGFSLFIVQEFEDIGRMDSVVEAAINDAPRFKSIVKLKAFAPFPSPARALENCNMISEGTVHDDLVSFLETHLPGFGGKKKIKMGVTDSKLATTISETLPQITCLHSGAYPVLREIFRGIRMHFATLVKGLSPQSEGKAQLGLGHGYSRAKVKFNVHRDDNMIIQSIALLDQLDKDINTFGMRIREWYSYHFPELFKLVPDHHTYCRCAALIKDRSGFTEETIPALTEITADEDKAREIFKASQTSMGMDISEIDLLNIERFTARVIALGSYRKQLQDYLHDKMDGCAPSLSALIGDQVGARLISHAGSLTNLAKYPASTIQILGAEKALFRALKTRGNTPKYGLLFNSTFIGRAQAKNKGRISRYLANKCAIASRVDCFSEVPVATFGEFLKQQVEDRLKYFDTGEKCGKNVDIMHDAVVAATAVQAKVLKKRKKKAKKDAAELAEQEQAEEQPSGKKKKKKAEVEEEEEEVQTPVLKKKKKKSMTAEEEEPAEETPVSKKKKKQKQKEVKDEPMDSD